MKTYIVGTHEKWLIEALLMGTHKICLYGEIRKISTILGWKKTTLSGAMQESLGK